MWPDCSQSTKTQTRLTTGNTAVTLRYKYTAKSYSQTLVSGATDPGLNLGLNNTSTCYQSYQNQQNILQETLQAVVRSV